MARPAIVSGHSQAVNGVDEFNRALRRISPQIKREFDKQNRVIGKSVVARGKAKAAGVSRQAAKAAESLGATAAGGGVAIRLTNRQGFELGAEFGAKQYPQFLRWTGNQWSGVPDGVGYFMHPAIRDSIPEVVDRYFDGVATAARAAGLPMSLTNATAFNALDIARS